MLKLWLKFGLSHHKDVCNIILCYTDPQLQSGRVDSRFAPCQWEMALLCNDVSHVLGASLESPLIRCNREYVSLINLSYTSTQIYLHINFDAISLLESINDSKIKNSIYHRKKYENRRKKIIRLLSLEKWSELRGNERSWYWPISKPESLCHR